MAQYPHLLFMQDGAPGHGASATKEKIWELGIQMIYWPPFSPDLNPIETVWNWIKDYLQANYPDRMTPSELRIVLEEAWESVPIDFFDGLIKSMPERC
jgi:transposase